MMCVAAIAYSFPKKLLIAPVFFKGQHLRRNLGRSRLVSLLGDWTSMNTEASRQDWAEHLSFWLGPFDAITLNAAHQSIKAIAATKLLHSFKSTSLTLCEELHQVREGLVKAMTTRDLSHSNDGRDRRAVHVPEQDNASLLDFANYRLRYLEQQRRMEWKIDSLRIRCRQVLSQTSSTLRQLAELDAALEQALGAREKSQLSKVPALLQRRFEYLRKSADDGIKLAQQQDAPALRQQSGGWVNVFDKDFHDAMRAELDFRLEPVVGLIEALRTEAKK